MFINLRRFEAWDSGEWSQASSLREALRLPKYHFRPWFIGTCKAVVSKAPLSLYQSGLPAKHRQVKTSCEINAKYGQVIMKHLRNNTVKSCRIHSKFHRHTIFWKHWNTYFILPFHPFHDLGSGCWIGSRCLKSRTTWEHFWICKGILPNDRNKEIQTIQNKKQKPKPLKIWWLKG